ncbi:MAG: hypothetical protein QOK37_3764 [Thermoanaerobaculia bacterium]|jgi:hypothetical protein|nr:hypothetical protein [Thermoanaerobaculia bacterium]
MTFVLRIVAVALCGLWMRWVSPVVRLPLVARAGVYVVGGLVTLAVEMILCSAIHLRWSVAALLVVPIAAGVASYWPLKKRVEGAIDEGPRPFSSIVLIAIAAISIAVLAIAVASGAATSFDLLLFWGPKGVRFAAARAIDINFLAASDNYLMHSDYPPLVPLLYAWTMLGKPALNWWGVIATAPLFLLLSTGMINGFARYAKVAQADAITAIFASLFAYLFIMNAVGGNGEPALIFFETLALCALTCTRTRADEHAIVASIALAAVVLTKVEGTPFVMLLLGSFALFGDAPFRERLRAVVKASVGPILALGGWIAFCAHNHLLDAYRPSGGALTMRALASAARLVGANASFGLGYLPWLIPLALVVVGRKRAALPYLIAALGYGAFLTVIYAHSSDAGVYVAWSATRVLLTPLLFFVFAALTASSTGAQAQARATK